LVSLPLCFYYNLIPSSIKVSTAINYNCGTNFYQVAKYKKLDGILFNLVADLSKGLFQREILQERGGLVFAFLNYTN
jgi:hypothetical protein